MDHPDPPTQDPTGQNRRQFMRTTGAASIAATVGLSGQTSAALNDAGEFESDPYSLGVASGDPLPDSVVLWTRLVPEPMEIGGGMPEEDVEVAWTVATDEALTDVVQTGTTTAEPEHAHAVHVEVFDLEPATEYYYQFEAGGATSPVGRTKTAPAPDQRVDEFEFAFASCQSWPHGYYTAYRHMAREELDLVIHLGDYIYEYGVEADGGIRDVQVPQEYREETMTLDRYRLQYGLYKSDPDLRDAHASAPWLVTRDDHEVDNNWADDVQEEPWDQETVEEFLQRRAAAFQAYYEHMPFRMEQKPDSSNQKLYRNYRFGDLVEFNVLDTRHYRDDQACGDAFRAVDCEERFEREILGDEQREWLLDNLESSEVTWDVLANQLPLARMDFKEGEEEGFRTDQWDGYVPDQDAVTEAMGEHADNAVVVTGDFHTSWACELQAADGEEVVGTEFVGTSISSFGDGTEMRDDADYVLAENDNVYYNKNLRGYAQCRVTPDSWETEYKVLDYVTEPGSPIWTDATFTVEAGEPGLQPQPATLGVDAAALRNGETDELELGARWLPSGLTGLTATVAPDDPDVATIEGVEVAEGVKLSEVDVADDGTAATVRIADLEDEITVLSGGETQTLATVEVAGESAGATEIEVEIDRLDDEDGDAPETDAIPGMVAVGPPAIGSPGPGGSGRSPGDLDGDGRYEDVNGNGRLDYDDVVTLFDEFESDPIRTHPDAYDFNENDRLDYGDVVALYEQVN